MRVSVTIYGTPCRVHLSCKKHLTQFIKVPSKKHLPASLPRSQQYPASVAGTNKKHYNCKIPLDCIFGKNVRNAFRELSANEVNGDLFLLRNLWMHSVLCTYCMKLYEFSICLFFNKHIVLLPKSRCVM